MGAGQISDTERAAYHEAGHAVVQYLLGMKTKRVSIIKDAVSSGRTEFTWPRGLDQVEGPPRSERLLECIVTSSFAGWAAERRRAGSARRVGVSADLVYAHHFSRCACSSKTQIMKYLREMKMRAQELIENEDNWELVGVVANALLNKPTMYGKQVREILDAYLMQQLQGTRFGDARSD